MHFVGYAQMSKTVDELIEHLFTKLRLEHAAAESAPKMTRKPCITIARDPGSGGKPIAEEVAHKLGFDFYDRKLIEAIAKSARQRKRVIANVDERIRTSIEDLIHGLFNPEYISDTTYINNLSQVVLSLIHQGNAVILGRGTNFIAPHNSCLSALVTAPKKIRIERAIQYEHINRDKAINTINKISKERRDFVSQYFGKNYDNPKYYDLVVNTRYLDIDAASNLIISAFRKKFPNLAERAKITLQKTTRWY